MQLPSFQNTIFFYKLKRKRTNWALETQLTWTFEKKKKKDRANLSRIEYPWQKEKGGWAGPVLVVALWVAGYANLNIHEHFILYYRPSFRSLVSQSFVLRSTLHQVFLFTSSFFPFTKTWIEPSTLNAEPYQFLLFFYSFNFLNINLYLVQPPFVSPPLIQYSLHTFFDSNPCK